jgi:hypothetical protein
MVKIQNYLVNTLFKLKILFISPQKWFFVKFGAGYPELESTTFRLNSSNPALPYISLFLFFNLFT